MGTIKVKVESKNISNRVASSNNKAQVYEQMALEHSNTAKQYAEQSESSAYKSKQHVDRLLENQEFITVSNNLELIEEVGRTIKTIDVEAILNAEASAKQSSESALASAETSTVQANISTAQAEISIQKAIEVSTNVNLANNFAGQALNSSNIAKEQATISTNQATISTTNANNALTYSNNAKTSEENALKYSNNAKTSETNALNYSNQSKNYYEQVKNAVPDNFTTLPIGTVLNITASNNYIPNGCLACNGAEYNKEDFETLWDNYLIPNLLNTCTYTDYNTEISTNGQCSKFAVLPFGYNSSILTVIGSPSVTTDGIASGFSTSNYLQKTNLFDDNTIFNVLEFEIEITPSTTSEHYMQIRTNDNNNQIVFTQSGNKLNGFVTTSGTSYNFNSLNIVINANVKYLIKAKHTADRFYLEVKNQETGAIQSGNIASVMPLINEKTVLYVGMSVFGGFTRNPIDLKKVSVSIDGKNILKCFEGNTFKVPTTINDKYTDFVVVANGMTDDCLVTWNTLVELENYLKGV